jgi:hypothetical protein
MVQPNYSPEEALNRVKLMMKYDSSKTLNENVNVIFEQSQSCSPAINETELDTIVNEVWDMLDKMTTIFSQAVYVEERAGKVYNNVNKLVGKKYYDDISKQCVSAKSEFLERFKVRSNKGGVVFSTEGDIIKLIDEALGETGVENSVKAQKYLNATKKILSTEDSSTPTTGGGNTDGTKNPRVNPVKPPPELKDVKAFQDWLDNNHGDDKEGQGEGWATGYKDGIINKGQNGRGYGNFGPRTQKAWATYKDQYLKGDTAAGTPAAGTPAAGTPAAGTTPEVDGEIITIDGTKQDF